MDEVASGPWDSLNGVDAGGKDVSRAKQEASCVLLQRVHFHNVGLDQQDDELSLAVQLKVGMSHEIDGVWRHHLVNDAVHGIARLAERTLRTL